MSTASPASEPASRAPTLSKPIIAARGALLESGLGGLAFGRAWSDAIDRWLVELFAVAHRGDGEDLALVAVGANGRQEPAPQGDVDLVLLHGPRREIGAVAEALWYPIWDAGLKLDHSVRSPAQARSEALADWKVSVGLLDARLIAGDERLLEDVAPAVARAWSAHARKVLPFVVAEAEQRHARHGDLAHLLEPDLKESRGGLRDVHWLRCAARAVPDIVAAPDARVARSFAALVGARVALHAVTGSASNVLTLQEQDAVADRLAFADADALMAAVSSAGRTVAIAADEARARVTTWISRRRGAFFGHRRAVFSRGSPKKAGAARMLATGLVAVDDEITLAADADIVGDPSLPLRAAGEAAALGLPLARAALDAFEAQSPGPEEPWPGTVRDALLGLLGAGPAAIDPFEALDQRGLIERALPEWSSVRGRPQRNALHRFTVDRHLLETAARAAGHTREVARPDLLLVGALLHDIGKGVPGRDHTEAGIELVTTIAPRMGFSGDDAAVLAALVEHHLLLPDAATRRDIHDPQTVEAVAAAVRRADVLELLAALAVADGEATGPGAWSGWKAGLVAELVTRTAAVLAGQPLPGTRVEVPAPEHEHLLRAALPAIEIDDGRVTVAVPDRPGVLGLVAGVLAVRGLDVRRAAVGGRDGVAVEVFDVVSTGGQDAGALVGDLVRALAGDLDIRAALAERARARAALARPKAAHPAQARVLFDDRASDATIVEVRAPDGVGVLARIAGALASCDVDIRRALVSTLGHEVVDAFYVDALPADRREAIEQAVLASLLNP